MAKNNISGSDNLESIDGIGPGYAKVLHKIGVHSFAGLAQYESMDDLRKDLLDQSGVDVPLWKIENKKGKGGSWLHQANELAKVSEEKRSPMKEKEVTRSSEWEEYVGFMVFFDSKMEDKGVQVWRTRTYKTENGDEELFPNVEPTAWVNWIYEQAQLPTALTILPDKIETGSTASNALEKVETTDAVRMKIVDVEVDEDPLSSILERKLIAEIQFEISDPESSYLMEQQSPFSIEIWLIELEKMSRSQVDSIESQLIPNTPKYTQESTFDMPPPGRYEIHTILLLHPPNEIMVSFVGPIINIVPESISPETVTA